MNNNNFCPICNKITKLDNTNRFRPFCSERCRLIDLGKWVDEKYSIADTPSTDNQQINDPEIH